MIDFTKPIRQKNGRRAVLLCEGDFMLSYTVKVAVEDSNLCWSIALYTKIGSLRDSGSSEDLENIPEESP